MNIDQKSSTSKNQEPIARGSNEVRQNEEGCPKDWWQLGKGGNLSTSGVELTLIGAVGGGTEVPEVFKRYHDREKRLEDVLKCNWLDPDQLANMMGRSYIRTPMTHEERKEFLAYDLRDQIIDTAGTYYPSGCKALHNSICDVLGTHVRYEDVESLADMILSNKKQ